MVSLSVQDLENLYSPPPMAESLASLSNVPTLHHIIIARSIPLRSLPSSKLLSPTKKYRFLSPSLSALPRLGTRPRGSSAALHRPQRRNAQRPFRRFGCCLDGCRRGGAGGGAATFAGGNRARAASRAPSRGVSSEWRGSEWEFRSSDVPHNAEFGSGDGGAAGVRSPRRGAE